MFKQPNPTDDNDRMDATPSLDANQSAMDTASEHHDSTPSAPGTSGVQASPVNYRSKKPIRAPFAWYGGKANHAKWILPHFPEHRVFIEPFGGAANMLLQKEPSEVEIYNDLDSRVVNFFNVIRDNQQYEELVKLLALTPYSRELFTSLVTGPEPEGPIKRAWRFFVLCRQARGGIGMSQLTPSAWVVSTRTRRKMAEPVSKYLSTIDDLDKVVKRLQTVIIENKPAVELIKKHDADDVFFYCDPPYLQSTRHGKKAKMYQHEMTDSDHVELLESLKGCRAKVMLSGYDSELYTEHLAAWRREEQEVKAQMANSGGKRVEVLWMNW